MDIARYQQDQQHLKVGTVMSCTVCVVIPEVCRDKSQRLLLDMTRARYSTSRYVETRPTMN